jgi:hypothetical protein
MNYRNQENEARTGPLIFSVPAYGFVMALYLDWLGTSRRAGSKSSSQEVERPQMINGTAQQRPSLP